MITLQIHDNSRSRALSASSNTTAAGYTIGTGPVGIPWVGAIRRRTWRNTERYASPHTIEHSAHSSPFSALSSRNMILARQSPLLSLPSITLRISRQLTMSQKPVPIIVVGQNEDVGRGSKEALKPDYEGAQTSPHLRSSPTAQPQMPELH